MIVELIDFKGCLEEHPIRNKVKIIMEIVLIFMPSILKVVYNFLLK